MFRRLYLLTTILLILLSCKKSRNSTSWNSFFSIPISTDTLNLNKLISQDKLYLSNDGTHVVFKDTFELYKIDQSIIGDDIQIEFTDTIIVPSILAGVPFPQGFQLPNQFSENHIFSFKDIKLKEIQFDSLIFDYEIESNVNGKLDLNLTIDGAFNENAQNFNTLITTDVQKKVTGKLNLNNYRFDFTDNGNSFNHLSTLFLIGVSTENNEEVIFGSDDIITIKFKISKSKIFSAKGYLGSNEINDTAKIKIPFMKKIASNNFELNDPKFELIIKNGIGIDAQLKLNDIGFNKNNINQSLNHSSINQNININRALDLGNDFQYSVNNLYFNSDNSNIHQLIGIFPDEVNIDYSVISNPLGNQSGYNDFIFNKHPLSLNLGVNIPLIQNFDSIIYNDTLDLKIPENLEIKNANIKLEFNNEFPCNCCVNLRLSSGDLINSSPICINSAQTDLLGNLMQSTISQYEINIGNDVLEKLQNSDKLIIDLVLTSPDSVTNFPILGIQNLYYSINMDLNTNIKLN